MELENKSKIQLKAEKDYISGLTYKKLSEKYGVSESTIKNWRKNLAWNRANDIKSTKKGNKKGKNMAKNSRKTAMKVAMTDRQKKESLMSYETPTLEEYEAIKNDLLNQLKNNGATGQFYNDLINTYMKMYLIKNELLEDIAKRGVNVEWTNGTQKSVKRNDSLESFNKTVTQMLNILTKLKLDIPENKNINYSEENDETL